MKPESIFFLLLILESCWERSLDCLHQQLCLLLRALHALPSPHLVHASRDHDEERNENDARAGDEQRHVYVDLLVLDEHSWLGFSSFRTLSHLLSRRVLLCGLLCVWSWCCFSTTLVFVLVVNEILDEMRFFAEVVMSVCLWLYRLVAASAKRRAAHSEFVEETKLDPACAGGNARTHVLNLFITR